MKMIQLDATICHKVLLVSFCNPGKRPSTGLLKIDLASESACPVDLGFAGGVDTCTGLARDKERAYVSCASAGTQFIVALKLNTFEPVFKQPLSLIKEGHSILARGKHLYIVSTGTDEVLRYDLTRNQLCNPQVVWRASVYGNDTHHLNSIAEWHNDIVISAFGPKSGTLWASALDGYLYNISRDSLIRSGIYHPHSLSVRSNSLYWCESHRKFFWSLDGLIFAMNGYTRGLCWISDRVICLGVSVGRKLSRSTGLTANPADPGEPAGSCGITSIEVPTGRILMRMDLGWFGPEIYDLLAIEEADAYA